MKRHRAAFLCALLAGLLSVSGARGDLLIFARGEDCLSSRFEDRIPENPHAVVLEAVKAREKEGIRRALAKAGAADVEFLGLPGMKDRTADKLEARWATKENIARVASLIRIHEDDHVFYYAGDEQDRLFLAAFADRCAAGANDPDCRMEKKRADEYLYEVQLIIDGTTNRERAAPAAGIDWRKAWEDSRSYDLTALPKTDGEGFLTEGEYILRDTKQGLWIYLSSTLRVTVTRHQGSGFSWLEADIIRKAAGETLHIVGSKNGRGNDPAKVARENHLVVGINTDYYQARQRNRKKTGLIIRNGKTVRESSGETESTSFPPLDTLLLDRSGGFRVDRAGTLNSEKALALKAEDVLAFGPVLIKDSRIRIMNTAYYTRKEPRTAVGRIGENHYLMIVAEGRMPSARGMTLDQLARLMAARGCTDAINLDGGHTSALVFTGERLNRIGNLSGTGTTVPRNMSELLGIGTYGQ